MAIPLAQSLASRSESGTDLRILVRGVNWLGDAVMTTPALLRLREKFPAAHLTLLTPRKLADLWVGHPAVDETVSFNAGDGVLSVARQLRTVRAQIALVLPNSPRSALEVFLAGIPERIGYRRPWRNFLLTQTVRSRPDSIKMHKRPKAEILRLVAGEDGLHGRTVPMAAHQLHEYLHLAALLGAAREPLSPQLFVSAEEVAAARQKFGLTTSSGLLLGLNPGAEYGPAKRWPAERFAAAAREIQRQTGCTWVLFGGPNDQAVTAQIQMALGGKAPVRNLAGQTNLRELMALLRMCRVLLTNDTGPMHVAAALGTPVVALFGSTSPELTGPGLPGEGRLRFLKSDAPCAPCFLRECPIDFRCMQGLAVDQVVAAVLEMVNG